MLAKASAARPLATPVCEKRNTHRHNGHRADNTHTHTHTHTHTLRGVLRNRTLSLMSVTSTQCTHKHADARLTAAGPSVSAQTLSTTSPTSDFVCALCEVVAWRAGRDQCGETSCNAPDTKRAHTHNGHRADNAHTLRGVRHDTQPHAVTHTFIHSYIHTFIHSYIHTFIHSYIHTFIHSHSIFIVPS